MFLKDVAACTPSPEDFFLPASLSLGFSSIIFFLLPKIFCVPLA
jgi:hypothetical protein